MGMQIVIEVSDTDLVDTLLEAGRVERASLEIDQRSTVRGLISGLLLF